MFVFRKIFCCLVAAQLVCSVSGVSLPEKKKPVKTILKAENFKHYVDYFNRMENENIVQAISDSGSWNWMKSNIPLFECPQDNFEEIFYFRWWTLRKHIKRTPQGYAFTEFLVQRSYADKYNLISCALGHHIMEARWILNPKYLDEYIHVWFRGSEGKPMAKFHKFSSWATDALFQKFLVDGDTAFLVDLYPDLKADFSNWEKEQRLKNGLFWQFDVRDGMEEQISGGRKEKNARPTINSYMFGNANALSKIATMAGDKPAAALFRTKADTLKKLIEEKLWNPGSQFFETVKEDGSFANVREEIGFIPWYFNLPDKKYELAWAQVSSEQGFLAPFGITTAERRHPQFRTHGCCNCEWDGAIWPFATSQTLTGMANWINQDEKSVVNDSVYFRLLELYVESQYKRGRPYVGEYLDEVTGYWLKGDEERSRYYNHSTFNDLIITGLIGLRPRSDQKIEVNPLIPEGKWNWFCLDNVPYHGRTVTIFWDKDGSKYGRGKGLIILVDGKEVARSEHLKRLIFQLSLNSQDAIKPERSKENIIVQTTDPELVRKATEWVTSLNLNDPEKEKRVIGAITTHLESVRNWHNDHPASAVPEGINPVTGKPLNELDRQIIADSAIPKSVHGDLMSGLLKDLTGEQIEFILDKYTVGKVAFTLAGYRSIVPDLTAEEETTILGFLKEAREMAIDYKSMKEISAIFEIYKTKSEQYLNSNGRNWRALYKTYVDAVKAKKTEDTKAGNK